MWWWFLQNALVSGLLAAVVAAVCRLRWFSPAVKHALWLIVLVKLVTPPFGGYRVPRVLDEQLSRLTSNPPRQQPDLPLNFAVTAEGIDVTEIAELLPPIEIEQLAQEPFPEPILSAELTGAIEQDDAGIELSRLKWIAVSVWIAGAVALAVVQLWRLIRLWRFVRQSAAAPAWLDRLVHQTAARLQVRPPQIAVVSAMCSPMVCSLVRPRLLWPARLSDRLAHDAHEAVLLHELAHLRRRDHWVAWLELVAGVIWWFNPIYWYARWQLRENAELACDAWVVAKLPEGRRTYAHALVEVTEFVSSAPVALPAVAMGNIARTSLERRLTMILRERFSYRVPLIGSGLIGLAMLAVLPGWSRGQQGQRSADDRASIPSSSAASADQASDPSLPKPGAARPEDTDKSADTDKLPDLTGAPGAGPGPLPGTTSAASSDSALPGASARNKFTATPDVTARWSVVGRSTSADQRIEEVEAKLAQLLAEIQQLRASGAINTTGSIVEGSNANVAVPQAGPNDLARTPASQTSRTPQSLNAFVPPSQSGTPAADPNDPFRNPNYHADRQRLFQARRIHRDAVASGAAGETETLTRVKYKLTPSLAQAARTFIEQYCKADIMVKAEGDCLTVIASPEDQNRIDVLVQLLHDSGRDTEHQIHELDK